MSHQAVLCRPPTVLSALLAMASQHCAPEAAQGAASCWVCQPRRTGAEVVVVEDQALREVLLAAEQHPANARVNQAVPAQAATMPIYRLLHTQCPPCMLIVQLPCSSQACQPAPKPENVLQASGLPLCSHACCSWNHPRVHGYLRGAALSGHACMHPPSSSTHEELPHL